MGKSMLEALTSKYENLADFTSQFSFVTYKYGTSPPNSKNSGDVCIPTVVVLDNYDIDSLGDLTKITDLVGHICELDLSHNALCNWTDIFQILKCCPKLEWLNLSQNPRLANDLSDLEIDLPALDSLRTLILNEVYVPWHILSILLDVTPSLESLYLCNNSMSDISLDLSGKVYPSIKMLFLNGNKLCSFDNLVKLGHLFPSVEKLTMIDNGITSLPEDTSFTEKFSRLVSLNLSENAISQYEDIDKLNTFECLTDVCLSDIAILSDMGITEEEFRFELIARLPHITVLNKTPISSEERTNAERAFIRRYMDCGDGDKPTEFCRLETKHGKLERLADVDLKPPETVQVLLTYNSQTKMYSMPVSFSVGEVKKAVCQEFACSPTKSRLFYMHSSGPEELKFPRRRFYSYKPDDGDELALDDKFM